ncbi:hypothetical protein GCM10007940_12000 [Portibacter lacus]|uniref:Uncharacterized protein n=2 Tax=Portibacter lacus TaxID=1099794 RepID=A0AA37SMD7_9BACT|nr:hypothetical protein GCM10007940_12000 [Portibacter lacus]
MILNSTISYTQCNDFENNISNWLYYNTVTGASTPQPLDAVNTIQSPGFNSQKKLYVQDRGGSTFIYNPIDFNGNYSEYFGRCLCFDIQLLVNDAAVKPSVFFVSGFDPTQKISWGVNPQKTIRFTANQNLPANSYWKNICVSFDECSGSYLPNNVDGTWEILGGGSCQDFNQVLSNVQGILFNVDMSGWPGTEKFSLDNICRLDCRKGSEPYPNPSGPSSPQFDLCCPPIDESDLTDQLNLSGNLNTYQPNLILTRSFKERIQAYVNYRKALNPCFDHFNIEYVIRKPKTEPNTFDLAQANILSRGATVFTPNQTNTTTWGQANLSDITLQTNKWYKLDFVFYGGPTSCADWEMIDECGVTSVEFNLQTNLARGTKGTIKDLAKIKIRNSVNLSSKSKMELIRNSKSPVKIKR